MAADPTGSWDRRQAEDGGTGGGGDASAALQETGNDLLALIQTVEGASADAVVAAGAAGTFSAKLRRLTTDLGALLTRWPAALGGTTASGSLPVVLSSDGPFATQTGSITETAPATDTASSGLNGRLQRIAQRITSLIGLAVTEDVAAASDPVGFPLVVRRRDTMTVAEVSTDGDNIAVNATSKGQVRTATELRDGNDAALVFSTSTLTTGQNALSTSNEVVIAANSARLFAEVKNADAAINVFLGKDNTVSTSNGHILKPGEAFAFDGYTGAIWAVAASGTPNVTFVEW